MTLFELVEQAHDVYEVLGDEGDVVVKVGDVWHKITDMRIDHKLSLTVLVAEEV